MIPQEQIALEKYNKGEKYSVSTFIDEDTIILGYGNLDYDFEFPLPAEITVKEYGTQSWTQFFRNKGLHKYRGIDKENKIDVITHYMSDEEFKSFQELNPNVKFIKL